MIKFEDLKAGDIVTAKIGGVNIEGEVNINWDNDPYFDLHGHWLYLTEEDFISAERPKKLPSEPGSVIWSVHEEGNHYSYAVLASDGRWYTSDGPILKPTYITEWEEH